MISKKYSGELDYAQSSLTYGNGRGGEEVLDLKSQIVY
jgi:hypothetical protein